MALSIGVSVGSRVDVGGHVLEVRALAHPNLIVLGVDGGPDVVITEEARKEVLPEVFVQTGVGPTGTGNRLAITAPKAIRISRIESAQEVRHGADRQS
jgi:hypothetical protein